MIWIVTCGFGGFTCGFGSFTCGSTAFTCDFTAVTCDSTRFTCISRHFHERTLGIPPTTTEYPCTELAPGGDMQTTLFG